MKNRATGVRQHGKCGACTAEGCPTSHAGPEPSLQGWRLSMAALAVFIAPCLLAIAGAAGGEALAVGELTGAITGLSVGLAGVWIGAKLVAHKEATS